MNENRDLSCDLLVIQLDLTTSDAVADDVVDVELPFDALPIFVYTRLATPRIGNLDEFEYL